MTDDLLNAECVINHLCDQNIISIAEWKHKHPNDQNYLVYFYNQDSKSDIQLGIIKRSGQYYVSRSRVAILAYRHRFNADKIYSSCKIN